MPFAILDLSASTPFRLYGCCEPSRESAERRRAEIISARAKDGFSTPELAVEEYTEDGPCTDLSGMAGWMRASGMSESDISRLGATEPGQ